MTTSKLTAKQDAFCREYTIDLNATQAAIRAGYSKKTAHASGRENLHKPTIAAKIAEVKEIQANRCDLTAERVLKEIMSIAMLDPVHLFDKDGRLVPIANMPEEVRRAIGGLDIHETYTGGRGGADDKPPELTAIKKIKLIDKIRALEMLGRHLALFVDLKKVDHTMNEERLRVGPTEEQLRKAKERIIRESSEG